MKPRIAIPITALFAVGSLTWATLAMSKEESNPSSQQTAAVEMDKEQAFISERVHMAAPMELVLENGVDPIDEAVRSGIIDATLEEVEAELSAAASTPDLQDDRDAIELKHRGSYRFFFEEN